jgi:uncharacterized protein (TIGR02301 family)
MRGEAAVRRRGALAGAALLCVLPLSAGAQRQAPQPPGSEAQIARETAPVTPPRPGDIKPYDEKLLRLTEILGAVHYLRELCGQNDGQRWRDRMREILEADGGSALRRAMLTRSFNKGYRDFGRTYQSCTPTAQTAISRFLAEGAQIADGLAKSVP